MSRKTGVGDTMSWSGAMAVGGKGAEGSGRRQDA